MVGRDRQDEAANDRPSIPTTSRRSLLRGTVGAGVAGMLGAVGGQAAVGTARGAHEAGHAMNHDHVLALVPDDRVTHTATQDGRWSDPATWDAGVPGADARVHIPAETTVTLAGATAPLHWLRVGGTYRVDPASDSHLRVETVVTEEGSRFEVGTVDDPVAPAVTARTTFRDRGPVDREYDPRFVSRGLLTAGAVSIHGADRTHARELATHPTAGADSLELAEPPTGWSAGDRIVVAPVDDSSHDEVREIAALEGSTVRLTEPLEFDHVPPRADLPVHVAHLTRNVRFGSESTATKRRGHLMFMTPEGVTVENAGMYGLGRTDKSEPFSNPPESETVGDNPKARYALHFHKTGIDRSKEPHRVTGCVADGSPGWGFVNHHSYAHFSECVSYDVLGAGFVTEGGDEQGSFTDNVAIKSEGSGQVFAQRANSDPGISPSDTFIDDHGHAGHGFWFHSPGTVNDGNVAAGHADYGFVYWGMPLDEQGIDRRTDNLIRNGMMVPPNYPKEYGTFNRNESSSAPGAENETHIAQGYVTIESFVDNTAYAVGSGLALRWMKPNHKSGQKRHTNYEDYNEIERFTAYGIQKEGEDPFNGANGIAVTWSSHAWIKDCTLLGEGAGRGINRGVDIYHIENVMVQDSTIADFQVGVAASPGPYQIIAGTNLDNERTNVRSLGGDHHSSPTIWLHNNTYRGAETNLFRHYVSSRTAFSSFFSVEVELFDNYKSENFHLRKNGNHIRLDDQKLYFDYQLPDVNPFAALNDAGRIPGQDSTRAAAEYVAHFRNRYNFRRAPNYPDELGPEDLYDMTNRQLDAQYDLQANGAMVPAEAERTSFERRTWVAPAEGTDVAMESDTMPPALPGMVLTDPPEVAIDGPTVAPIEESVTFEGGATAADGDAIESLEWRIGDATGTGEQFTHAFAEAGTYTVELTATAASGRRATARQEVDVTAGGGPLVIDVGNAAVRPGTTTTVPVVAEDVPGGFAGGSLTVSLADERLATVEEATVEPAFTVAETAIEDGAVRFTLLDGDDVLAAGDGPVTLGTVTVRGEREGSTRLSLSVENANDDTGEPVDPTVRPGRLHVGPTTGPVEDGLGAPTDPDADGKFEDVNGNEEIDYADVVELAESKGSPPISDDVDAFDFDPDGDVGHGDLLALLEEV